MEHSPQVPALLMPRPDEERCYSPAHLTTPWRTPAATVHYTYTLPQNNTNSQCSDRQIKTISSENFWTHRQSLKELGSFIFGQVCKIWLLPDGSRYCIKAYSDDHTVMLSVYYTGLFQLLLVTVWLLLIHGDVTTAWFGSCQAQWEVRCQIIPVVGIDY